MKTEAEIKKEVAVPFSEFVRIVLDNQEAAHKEGYSSGHDDGYELSESEMEDVNEEKIGVEYAIESFKDCITLEDFQSKYRELTNLACTFMPTLGLKR